MFDVATSSAPPTNIYPQSISEDVEALNCAFNLLIPGLGNVQPALSRYPTDSYVGEVAETPGSVSLDRHASAQTSKSFLG